MTGPAPEGNIKTWQAQLGVAIDGVWGPKTQAAYDARLRENKAVEEAVRPHW